MKSPFVSHQLFLGEWIIVLDHRKAAKSMGGEWVIKSWKREAPRWMLLMSASFKLQRTEMAHSRISPRDIINFSWSALCKNSLEFTQRENYIMIGTQKRRTREEMKDFFRLYVGKMMKDVSFDRLSSLVSAQQKGRGPAHMLFLRIGCRHQRLT